METSYYSLSCSLFSNSYSLARKRFLEASEKAQVRVDSLVLEGIKGPDGEELATDIAWIGSSNPEKVIIHSSGVHGVEGYAGSAIQLQILSQLPPIEDNIAILLVHCVNPYGMSWHRRWNENNVDLNRNCMTDYQWSTVPQKPNEIYSEIYDFINPKEEPLFWSGSYWPMVAYYTGLYGYNGIKQALAGGQYQYPNGLWYGGKDQPEKGIQNLFSYLKEKISNCKHYCHIDVHTGLGPKGYDSLLTGIGEQEWNEKLGDHIEKVIDSSGTFYLTSGGLPEGLFHLFGPNTTNNPEEKHRFSFLDESEETANERKTSTLSFNEITQEFGTYSGPIVAKALREENFFYQKDHQLKTHWSKDEVRNVFYIKETEWETTVVTRGRQVLESVIEFITSQQ